MIILPIYQGTQKVASFQWYLGQKKTLQQVPAAVQVPLPLGLYNPADLMVLGVSIVECHDIQSLCQAPISGKATEKSLSHGMNNSVSKLMY